MCRRRPRWSAPPEPPPPPQSSRPPRAQKPEQGLSPPRAAWLSQCGGRGVPTSKETPPFPTHPSPLPSPHSGKTDPSYPNRNTLLEPHLSARAGPPRTQKSARRGVPGCPSCGPQALPQRPPPAPGAPRPPHPRLAPAPAGRACLSALPPLRVNINQELMRSRTALKVPPGTVSPWLRDLGGSHVRDTETYRDAEGRPARGAGTHAPETRI